MILYGASGHCKVVVDICEARGIPIDYIVDDNPNIIELQGYKVCRNKGKYDKAIVTIGSCQIRKQIVDSIEVEEYVNAIHPTAIISPYSVIDPGTVIMQGAIVQSSAHIGRHCIINTGASVGHDVILGDFVHVAPHATITGGVEIGEGTWIGAGAVVKQGIKIGRNCMIGVGSVVVDDIPDNVVAFGNKCKVIRSFCDSSTNKKDDSHSSFSRNLENAVYKGVFLYGAGSHGKVIKEILQAQGISVNGFIDDNSEKNELCGLPVIHNTDNIEEMIVSIGVNANRKRVAEGLKCKFGKAIHPSAVVSSSAEILEGSVVMAGAIIIAESKIGKHCIVNTGASIDHECVLGDYVHVSPRATLCGNISVGEGSWIGAGSIVVPGVKIGRWCVVGAGSVVTKDIPDGYLAVGNRCKLIKQINADLI